jgi:hypothetical protein
MKHASLLIVLCALFSLSAVAQSTTTEQNKTQRITITTKKVDDNGKTVTETWIAEGENPHDILKEMAVNPGMMQQVEVESDIASPDAERLFLFKSAGDHVVIEGKLDSDVDMDDKKVIIISKSIELAGDQDIDRTHSWNSDKNPHHAYMIKRIGQNHSNCAALGVYSNNDSDEYGATVNRIIEQSGAEKAGLKEGDVIKKVEEFDVSDFESLHFALSNFLPGDEVNVDFMREGKYKHASVTLTNWSDIPGHEYRARTDCGEPELPTTVHRDDPDVDEPTGTHDIRPLELTDVRIFPNPNDGIFALSFTPEAGPLSVAITDVNGKVVYSDQMVNAGSQYQRDINIANVPQGNYIITVTQGDKVYNHQISKQ